MAQRLLALQGPAPDGYARPGRREEIQHVISLGCRCSQASIYKALQRRRYACPFDWIFSSTQMILHCLRDDFVCFLDRSQYFLNATMFDSIGLPPGRPPRQRNVIGHSVYSEMMAGVGRGAIFNHRDPLHNDEDYDYTVRTVERFRCVLACGDRKLFVVLNLNTQLWSEVELRELFEELLLCTDNFELLAVNCIRKVGHAAATAEPEELAREDRVGSVGGPCRLRVYQVQCIGDNTGSYFRDDRDAERVRRLLAEPYHFALAGDPLPEGWRQPVAPEMPTRLAEAAGGGGEPLVRRRWTGAVRAPGVDAGDSGSAVGRTMTSCEAQFVEQGMIVESVPKQVRRWVARTAAA